MPRSGAIAVLLLVAAVAAADDGVEVTGHTKFRLVGQEFSADSLLRDFAGANSLDAAGELRLNLAGRSSGWSLQADYQLLGLYSEFLPLGAPNDDARLMDLTREISDGTDRAWLHRLDRLWVGYAGRKFVLRAGRQALSWGNGLYFHPLDLVNPFDPTTVDTEYKTGDDMLYAQYLRDNGDDLQAAAVFRRDLATGRREADAGTSAVKYHGFLGNNEYDVLVAADRGDTVVGLGAAGDVGGAVVRGDLVVRDGDAGRDVEFVTNLSYSWTWGGRNVSGAGEYYRSADDRNYVAGSLLVEMSPLWTVTPTLVGSVDDPSALLQLVTQYSLGDNATFLGSLNVPLGADGTEFGAPVSAIPGRYLSLELGIFAQLAWYF